jgi:hypothetical protein
MRASTMRTIYLLSAVCMALVACGPARDEPPPKSPMPVSETVFAPTISTLDKARSVEGTLQQGNDNADAAIKAAQ